MPWLEKRTQTKEPAWRVVWREAGKKQQQTFYDEDEAADFFAAVKRAKNHWPADWIKGVGWRDQQTTSTAPTFREYAERTIAARARADERTKADYLRMLTLHVYPVLGHKPIDTVTRFDVGAVIDRMRAAGRAHKTIANIHAVLSSVLDDALRKEDPPLVRRNVAEGELPEDDQEAREMVHLEPGEFAQICRYLDDGLDTDLAVALVATAMRWSEITALQVHDVDLFARRLSVRRAWKRRGNTFELGRPKTKQSRRTISLAPALVSLLAPYVVGKQPSEFVFTTANGRPIRHSNWYNRAWRPAVLRARQCDTHAADPAYAGKPCGCPGTLAKQPGIHALRHTGISWLVSGKVSWKAVQERAGHKSAQLTLDRYSHVVASDLDEVDAAVDAAISRLSDYAEH